MSVGFIGLLQWILMFVLLASVVGLWVRHLRPPKEDPRLSKGLQLLQSKIAILEDLSDRTDSQVQQLNALIEKKARDLQERILQAEQILQKTEQSLHKIKEVSRLFEDRIPHQEIVERQNTVKYVKAARMAHQGAKVEDICREVGLLPAEAEFIAKVNRDQLMFCEDSLPDWVESEEKTSEISKSFPVMAIDSTTTASSSPNSFAGTSSLNFSTGEGTELQWTELRKENPKAWMEQIKKPQPVSAGIQELSQQFQKVQSATPVNPSEPNEKTRTQEQTQVIMSNGKSASIKPVEFKKIDWNKNLG